MRDFFVIGISYRKADAAIRGRFSLSDQGRERLLEKAGEYGASELFVLSTCNRTEIYGFAWCPYQLAELLCSCVEGTRSMLEEKGYMRKNGEAAEHLLNVACGLDSQILGDYEIARQLKESARFSRERNALGAHTERLICTALSASKIVKNRTELSSGTVSVSYAAVKYLQANVEGLDSKNVLVIGAGSMGQSCCKNLLAYTSLKNVTIANRTLSRAKSLAGRLKVNYAPLSRLDRQIADADVIILATASHQPLLGKEQLSDGRERLIIDLSVPRNIDRDVSGLPGIRTIDVDELSRIKDATLRKRKEEIPVAVAIVAEKLEEFLAWKEKRKHAGFLRSMKDTLVAFSGDGHHRDGRDTELTINRIVRKYANKVERDPRYGCHVVEAISRYVN